jgi:hypothetical protein
MAAVLLAAAGCAHAVPATAVRFGAQCGGAGAEPSARWLGTEAAAREALGTEGPIDAAGRGALPVDFAKEGVVLVGMGSRPTAGYALTLSADRAEVKDGVATIAVRFEEPAPGAMLAQMLTSPCLLVALPREGLREVRVVDASGAVRARTAVSR